MKKIFVQGLLAGALAAAAGVVFLYLYQSTFMVDYSAIINVGAIIGSSMIGCMLIALGHFAVHKLQKPTLLGWLNLLICILSFASIIGPIGMDLPLDIEFPELFPGLVIPMHFFPALAYFAVAPFFPSKPR